MDFLKNNPRFSFSYGDKVFAQLTYTKEQACDGNKITTVYTFSDGLRITNIATGKGGAYEWVNWLENTADTPTQLISDLWDCDVTLPLGFEDPTGWVAQLPDTAEMTQFIMPQGSIWHYDEFSVDVTDLSHNRFTNQLKVGQTVERSAYEGLSSGGNAPFFNVHKQGGGYIVAIGWTGQWRCRVSRGENSVSIQTGIENAEFYLRPGEKFRTSSVVILPYEGTVEQSQNYWRRLVRTHYSLIGSEGRDAYGPLCAGIWGGMRSSSALERIDTIRRYELPFEYIWMDAGWYGAKTQPTPDEYEGDWPEHVGDWRISPQTHPGGLRDVSKAVHEAGMKFLLWFEPERVRKSVPIVKEHPEYFLSAEDPDDQNLLLNLGDENALRYCIETISGIIAETGVDCYRQDFNITPLKHWEKNDTEGRRGITQILHINGLYRFWDALLERFPHLLIDNCSGGGRRIDIEMMRRSIPLWRTDYMCPSNFPVEAIQCHHMSFGQWMPYSGTGSGRIYDTYRIRSCYDTAMTTNFTFSERNQFGDDPQKMQWLKARLREYLRIRPYFNGDLYQLTKISPNDDVWSACQFDRPESGDGIVQVFRRENAPYDAASFFLRGIDGNAMYVFTDLDDESEIRICGAELVQRGFAVSVAERRAAKIWQYKKLLRKGWDSVQIKILKHEDVLSILPDRKPESHKGDYGRILLLCGSVGYTGAAALAAMGALRSGSGLVFLGVPESIYAIEAVKLTEAIIFPLPEEKGKLSRGAIPEILKRMENMDAVLIGPGLGQSEDTFLVTEAVLRNAVCPVILDADGINALAGHMDILRDRHHPTILTPHVGEFGRICEKITPDRVFCAAAFARENGCVLLLKGHETVITDGENCYANQTGNPGMAVGGSGDVLAGMITSLVGQGIEPLKAAACGAWLHGAAGDICAKEIGQYGMLPGDMVEVLPRLLK